MGIRAVVQKDAQWINKCRKVIRRDELGDLNLKE